MLGKIASMAFGAVLKSPIFLLSLVLVQGTIITSSLYLGYRYATGQQANDVLEVVQTEIAEEKTRKKKTLAQDKIDVAERVRANEIGYANNRRLRNAALKDPGFSSLNAGPDFMQAWVSANRGLETDRGAAGQSSGPGADSGSGMQ